MSNVEAARFGAWFDRLQAMVFHALDRLTRADVLTFVPEDVARLLAVDAATVIVGLDDGGTARIGRHPATTTRSSGAEHADDDHVIDVARGVNEPRLLTAAETDAIVGEGATVIRSGAAAPLRGRERVGVVAIGATGAHAFDTAMIGLLRVVSDQFARVFDSARLLDAERAARERAEFLADLNDVLTRTLDVDEIMHFVTRAAVPRLADWSALLIPATRPDAEDRREFWHSSPERVELARELALRSPRRPDAGPMAVIQTGEPRIFPRLTADDLEGTAPRLAEIARKLDLGSVVIVPLQTPRGVIGALSLMRERSRPSFSAADVELAHDVAARLAVGLHNAMQYEDQVTIAAQLQQSLLPRALPQVRGLELAGSYWAASRTADVGGDLYDVFALDEDRCAVLIGDVSGKGIDAAVLTALVRHTARAAARHTSRPTDVLQWVNDAFLEQEYTASEMFCTAAFGIVERDADGFRFVFSLAGHPQPVIVRSGGRAERTGQLGQAIGLFPEIDVEESTATLAAGDVLMLFTDGVTDVAGDTALDEEAWTRVVRDVVADPAARSASAISELAEEWLTRHHAAARDRDDVALLVIRVAPDEAGVAAGPRATPSVP